MNAQSHGYFHVFQVFKSKGIQYKKIRCPGQVVPAGSILKE